MLLYTKNIIQNSIWKNSTGFDPFFVLFSLTENDIFGALLIHTNQNVFGKFLPEKVWENDRIFPYSILL